MGVSSQLVVEIEPTQPPMGFEQHLSGQVHAAVVEFVGFTAQILDNGEIGGLGIQGNLLASILHWLFGSKVKVKSGDGLIVMRR